MPLRHALQYLRRRRIARNIDRLGGDVDLNDPRAMGQFAALFDGYVPENCSITLIPAPMSQWPCRARNIFGGFIEFGALIYDAQGPVAVIRRQIFLGLRAVNHSYLVVDSRRRGQGHGLRCLRKSIGLYDRLGIRYVAISAALDTGRWFWAECGFQFTNDQDRIAVRAWFDQVIAALGRQYQTAHLRDPEQFARLGDPDTVSFAEIAAALPQHRQEIERRAAANNFAMNQQLEFGKAVLLTGPEWDGFLDLEGPRRRLLEERFQTRL
jgi:GNAT superfamily N-acetyltransferase